MKHIAKSLFFTSILTVPSMFGAESKIADSMEGRYTTHSSVSIVDIVSQAGEFIRANDSQSAARVYADYAMHPDALWFHILFSVQMIERLGHFNIAIDVLKWSKIQSNTHYFKLSADAKILKLRQALDAQTNIDAQAPIPGIPLSVFKYLGTEFFQIRKSALQCKEAGYKQSAAELFLKLANHPESNHLIVFFAATNLLQMGELYYEKAIDLFKKFAGDSDIRSDAILSVADRVRQMGPAYHVQAVELYKMVTHHPNVTPQDMLQATLSIQEMGFDDDAIALYEELAAQKDTPFDLVFQIATKLIELGQLDMAVSVYKKSATQLPIDDIFRDLEKLKAMGLVYYPIVFETLKMLIDEPRDDVTDEQRGTLSFLMNCFIKYLPLLGKGVGYSSDSFTG
ncbi:tetratricopeptide repeat protein [Candidatus Bodocaedibacter vickermanii]|uniref:Tetratricopeptide repeat-containing protein n=1 Tax=Candidatus Bodocaedibacter vickermanii TaxID=2741701 RepID=A0A7L9RUH2_9PROT|nr:hypothetical protein CPBP_01059 [Candidatus Paracaedibacteraceae bacterium 'Lake Konstanz']